MFLPSDFAEHLGGERGQKDQACTGGKSIYRADLGNKDYNKRKKERRTAFSCSLAMRAFNLKSIGDSHSKGHMGELDQLD